jgi:hypothetical protein
MVIALNLTTIIQRVKLAAYILIYIKTLGIITSPKNLELAFWMMGVSYSLRCQNLSSITINIKKQLPISGEVKQLILEKEYQDLSWTDSIPLTNPKSSVA